MRFAYRDLGQQPAGSMVVVRLRGSSANVVLLDSNNFASYRAGTPFVYAAGGLFRTSPVRLEIPHDDHWFLAVDTGGFRGRVRASFELIPAGDETSSRGEEQLVEQS
jgi:Domain of unknown function (DUF1883)